MTCIDGETGIDTLEGGPGADDLRLGPNILKEVYKGGRDLPVLRRGLRAAPAMT